MKILIAEDDSALNQSIVKNLSAEGYEIDSCKNGEEALEYLSMAGYDVAVFDIMMPVMDGLEAVRRMRAKGNATPVIFLTAKDTVQDKVNGLDIGANDYIVKPFSFKELVARIHAVTRTAAGNLSDIYSLADLTLDSRSHIVTRGGVQINLSGREYSLLEYLLMNQGRILPKAMIENHVWGYDYMGGTNVVSVYIGYLRKKVDEGHKQKLIHTVKGIGFVMRVQNEE